MMNFEKKNNMEPRKQQNTNLKKGYLSGKGEKAILRTTLIKGYCQFEQMRIPCTLYEIPESTLLNPTE